MAANPAEFKRELRGNLEIRYLRTSELRIDHDYQRALSVKRAKEYAEHWDEDLSGILEVSRRLDGSFIVIDGQHRLEAALRAGIDTLLCNVHHNLTKAEEADMFDRLGTRRVTLSSRDRFRARLVAGDEIAHAIQEVVQECGFELDLKHRMSLAPRSIAAVRTLEQIYRSGLVSQKVEGRRYVVSAHDGEAAIRRVLTTINECWPDQKEAVQEPFLLGIHWFWQTYTGELSRERAHEKWRMVTAFFITARANGNKQLLGGSAPLWVARFLLEQWNKSKRVGRLADRLPTTIRSQSNIKSNEGFGTNPVIDEPV